jgi:phospholipid N-methyltransferase
MVRAIDWPRVNTVVELGAGTGAVSSQVIGAAPSSCRVILIERSPRLAEVLRVRYPTADVVHGDAQQAAHHCRRLGVSRADVILAGLPWASLPVLTQWRCLRRFRSLLADDGSFATYAQLQGLALPAGRRFARELQAAFAHVRPSGIVWRSVPPSLVYHCRGVIRTRDRAPGTKRAEPAGVG